MERAIRNSAKALIMKDGKMLVIKIRDNDEEVGDPECLE